jgi:regulator of sigma E protease
VSPWSLLLAGGIAYAAIAGWWGLLVGVLGLALLITVHEFGHFIAAKAFGMRVEKFYVGFPPAALRHTWGETEYGIGIIPLGGFCKISGMTPEEEVPEGTGDRLYYLKPVWQRNVAIFAGPLMNFIAAAVILIIFVAVQGVPNATLTIDEVVAGGPAAKAGITVGALIVAADGTEFATWDEASAYFRAHPNTTIELTYVPEGGSTAETRTVEVALAEHPQQPGAGYLGVRSAVVTDRPGPLRAVVLGMQGFWGVVTGTFKGFDMLFSGEISATGPDGVMGPVGIIDVSQDAVEQDWYPVLLAFLSFNLGLINLLPILPFDGGHIAFNLLERVRGKRLNPELFARITAVVTVLLLTLFVLLTLNDVRRIIGG